MGKFTAVFVLALVCVPAMAACGGGGWKTSDSAKRADGSPVYVSASHEVKHLTGPAKPFDTSKFDSITDQLNLSHEQREDVASVKGEIKKEWDRLEGAVKEAQAKLDKCTGPCDAEKAALEQAKDAWFSYDPNADFEHKLDWVLWDRQRSVYFAAKK